MDGSASSKEVARYLSDKFLLLLYVVIFFALVLFVQLFFFLFFIIAFSKKKKLTTVDTPPLTVIVCAHDELENLQQLLPLLIEQDYPEYEIIIVNDRSNDDTFDWLMKQSNLYPKLKYVNIEKTPEHINGKKYGITLGVRAATHEWLVFTDADCRPTSPNWLREMAKAIQPKSQFVLSISPYLRQPGMLNKFIRFEAWITIWQYMGFALNGMPYMGVGRNLAYRKSLFMERKGFNQFLSIIGGDDDLFVNQHATSVNTAVALSADAVVESVPATNWKAFFNQKVRHLAAGKKYRSRHKIVLGIWMTSWIFIHPIAIALLFSLYSKWVALALVFRVILMIVALHIVFKQWKQQFELWAIPLLDYFYPIYYLTTGITAFVTKKIRWKN